MELPGWMNYLMNKNWIDLTKWSMNKYTDDWMNRVFSIRFMSMFLINLMNIEEDKIGVSINEWLDKSVKWLINAIKKVLLM